MPNRFAAGCGCCLACNRECESAISNPWEFIGDADDHWSNLTLTGVNSSMVTVPPDRLKIEVRSLFGEWRVQLIGSGGVLAEYSAASMPSHPVTLTLTEVNSSGVSGSITKISNLADDQDITVQGTRRPKLIVDGVRIYRISWELLSIPDPWEWSFTTTQRYFPNDPITLTDTWNGTSGLIGEYVVTLSELQCRDGSIFSLAPYFQNGIDNSDLLEGTLDGWSPLFDEDSQRVEWTPTTVPAFYGLSFIDTVDQGISASLIHDKQSQFISATQSLLLRGFKLITLSAPTCSPLSTQTFAVNVSNLSGYTSTSGPITWRMRLLDTETDPVEPPSGPL